MPATPVVDHDEGGWGGGTRGSPQTRARDGRATTREGRQRGPKTANPPPAGGAFEAAMPSIVDGDAVDPVWPPRFGKPAVVRPLATRGETNSRSRIGIEEDEKEASSPPGPLRRADAADLGLG